MKKAPNLNKQPADKFTEQVIFAGKDAWLHAKDWQQNNRAGDNVPPVVLTGRELENLSAVRIIDKGRRFARVCRAGALSEREISMIATLLALADVKEARFYSESHELLEDWTPRLVGLKAEAERGESSVMPSALTCLPDGADLARMAASERGRVLAAHYGCVAVNPDSNTVYVYRAGIWEKITNSDLKRTLGEIFDAHDTPYNPRALEAAVEAMKIMVPVMLPVRPMLIGFTNGVYDLSTGQFLMHSPANGLLNHNGITFTDPLPEENLCDHAPCFHRWLMHAAGGNMFRAKRILAALFMVLANRHDWQLFIEVTGEGGSGKSVFTAIASLLAGKHNTASGNMRALDEARGRAQFVGKKLIILPDQPRYTGPGTGIKAITGGDPVEIDGKYEKQFSTVLSSVIIATNNEPMVFTERNGGIARRRVIFLFDHPVSEADRDLSLADKITQELLVIIRRLLSAFRNPDSARQLLQEQRDSAEAMHVKQYTDPLYGFCEHIVVLDDAAGMLMGNLNITPRAPRTYLYHAYRAYMEAHGFDRVLSLTRFGADFPKVMKEYGAEYRKIRTNAGMRYNMELAASAEDWLPAVPRMPDRDT